MNHVLIATSAVLGVCVVLLTTLLVALVRRSGRRADARVDTVVRTLEARMDELAQELAGAVRRAEEEGRRSRFLGEIAGSIDLDDVLARTLEAAGALPGVDAALVRLDAHEGKPVVATLGLSTDEAERQAVAGPPDGRDARSIELTYRYAPGEPGDDLVHGGLAVPLAADDLRIGFLTVFTRSAGRRYEEEDVRGLEELAERAGPAIENARRFREARQLADLDALTGLHNRRYFHETLGREVARAHRYERRLALIVFDLDDFKEINDRIGHLGGDAVLAEAGARVRDVVRSADIACRVGGDEFAVILPESDLDQAQQLVTRIQQVVGAQPMAKAGPVRLSAGVAELQPQDDPIALFERADEQLYAAKQRKGGIAAQSSRG